MIEIPQAELVTRMNAKNGSANLLRALARYHVKHSRLNAAEMTYYGRIVRG
jgi:hypothetical protein